jgi:hypothetical protein
MYRMVIVVRYGRCSLWTSLENGLDVAEASGNLREVVNAFCQSINSLANSEGKEAVGLRKRCWPTLPMIAHKETQ